MKTVRLSAENFAEIRRIVELYVLEWQLIGENPPKETETLYGKLMEEN